MYFSWLISNFTKLSRLGYFIHFDEYLWLTSKGFQSKVQAHAAVLPPPSKSPPKIGLSLLLVLLTSLFHYQSFNFI